MAVFSQLSVVDPEERFCQGNEVLSASLGVDSQLLQAPATQLSNDHSYPY
jgi:hypothetical protein